MTIHQLFSEYIKFAKTYNDYIPEDYEYMLEENEILQLKYEEEMIDLGWEIN
jgi:hypothetical protein